MRVFVTGATGFLGAAIVRDLLRAGHQVLGLARSDTAAATLRGMGADAHPGDLEDLDSLRRGAGLADGVIHAGFDHDFSRFAEACAVDGRVIEALGRVQEGTDRPLIVTAGIPSYPGRLATEEDDAPAPVPAYPRVSEQTALAAAARGVRASVVRLPQVHDQDRQGLASYLAAHARQTGISAYPGAGLNRWSAVHRLDAAPVFRLALERGAAGERYHAVTEEGVTLRAVAEVISRGLSVPVTALPPEEAAGHFGPLAFAAAMDNPASGDLTRRRLGWRPAQAQRFLADLELSAAALASTAMDGSPAPPIAPTARGGHTLRLYT
jgi:nucleoside-diphosphate-sugar epimerase